MYTVSATRLRTTLALGLRNVGRVAAYRLLLRAGIHPVQRIPAVPPPHGPFYGAPSARRDLSLPAHPAERSYFGWQAARPTGIPDWHLNPFTGARSLTADAAWWTLGDFDAPIGDIKAIWELSRLDWVMRFAQRAAVDGAGHVDELNRWLADWCARNAPYRGLNWKCGQEASIRVIHLAAAALILDQAHSPQPALVALVALHLERIAPTMAYAIGQDNNHGTSEAAALLVGGSWLERVGDARGARWHQTGRAVLADRAARLIATDGSFSQYSVNYHRLMIETICFAEAWRRHLRLEPLAPIVYSRAAAASAWLRAMIDPASGDAPNIGANDGANLLPMTDAGYRDFRPAAQLAAVLFEQRVAFASSAEVAEHLSWLGVEPAVEPVPALVSRVFDDGGYAVLRRGSATAVLRYPRFRFRPSHADALHVDLWLAGDNLLRDGGTFSYNVDAAILDYFSGCRSHNTAQFDDEEQMPRLGRFLWGSWLRTKWLEPVTQLPGAVTVGAAYDGRKHVSHARRLELRDTSLVVRDQLAGFANRAVLRWRLRPAPWRVEDGTVSDGVHRLRIFADVSLVRCEIVDGWESRYYMRRTALPVLEVEVATAGTIVTEYEWGG